MARFLDLPKIPTYYLWANGVMVILLLIPAAQDASLSAGMFVFIVELVQMVTFQFYLRRAGRD